MMNLLSYILFDYDLFVLLLVLIIVVFLVRGLPRD